MIIIMQYRLSKLAIKQKSYCKMFEGYAIEHSKSGRPHLELAPSTTFPSGSKEHNHLMIFLEPNYQVGRSSRIITSGNYPWFGSAATEKMS